MKTSIGTRESRDYDSLYHIPKPGKDDGEMPPAYELGEDNSIPEAAVRQLERDGVPPMPTPPPDRENPVPIWYFREIR